MADSNEIPLLYLFVYKKLIEKFGKYNRVISRKALLEIWRRCIHNVPRKYDYYILKEMCDYGLLERINNQEFKLFSQDYKKNIKLNTNFNLLEDLSPSELQVLNKLGAEKYKLLGADANQKLKKLNDFFLW